MVILVPDHAWFADIERAGAGLAQKACTAVVASDGAHLAVQRAREKFGGQTLAYVARSERAALDAIEAGADEALNFTSFDPQRMVGLIERAERRAALRRAADNERSRAVQAEKLSALGTVVAGVAHEINNPLAAVCLSVEFLKNALGPVLEVASEVMRAGTERDALSVEQVAQLATRLGKVNRALEGKRVLDDMLDLVDTIAAIVRDLRIYARSDEVELPQPVDVADLIEQVLRVVGSEISTRAQIERDYAPNLPPLLVPRSRAVQVLTNVLLNAAHAIEDVQRAAHRVRIVVRASAGAVTISVSDTGPGIAPDAIERIFDPYYTTKRHGRGTGLGLSISRSILLRLGGELMVESVQGEGATFTALFPQPERDKLRGALAKVQPSSIPPPGQRRVTVLVVDDDERLLRVYPRVLRDRYEVLTAVEGQAAIALISSGVHVDVVLTDLSMPAVNGEQLFRWLQMARPDLARRTLFISGVSDLSQHPFLSVLPNLVLEKPATGSAIFAAIDRVLGNEQAYA